MTAWWCQHGADYVVIRSDHETDAHRRARRVLATRGRDLSLYDEMAALTRLDQLGPVTVRPATPADLAVWADHLASLEPTPTTEEPML